MWKWFKLSCFFFNKFIQLFLQAGGEYRRLISKGKLFRLQDRTKEDFPPLSHVYTSDKLSYI